MSGLIPNRKGQPLIHKWFGVRFKNENYRETMTFQEVLDKTQIHRRVYPNKAEEINTKKLQELLKPAVEKAQEYMNEQRELFEEEINTKLDQQLRELEKLKRSKLSNLEKKLKDSRQPEHILNARRSREERAIEKVFSSYMQWIEDTMTTERQAWIQVLSLARGACI